jgi:hypothetical protein
VVVATSTLAVAGRCLFAHETYRFGPADRIVQGQVSGVAVDPRGRLLALHSGENR